MFDLPSKTLRSPAGLGVALAAVAALTAAAVVVHRKSAQAEANNPPLGKFIEVDGVRLHYLERGSGTPIVLLHGNGSMIQDFTLSGVVDALSHEHRVIAFDRPGFGYSSRPSGRIWNQEAQATLLKAALDQLGIERAVLVGHSWGTMVANAFALAYPQSVVRLVLMSGYYYPTPRLDVPVMSIPAIPGIGTVMRHTLSPLISRLLWPLIRKQLFAPAKVSASFMKWPVWMTLRPSQLRASAAETAMMIPGAMQMADRYGELTMPVTVLAGDGDKIVNTTVQSERLHAALSHSTLQVVPGAGHMVHHIDAHTAITAILGEPTRLAANDTIKLASTIDIPLDQAAGLTTGDASNRPVMSRGA